MLGSIFFIQSVFDFLTNQLDGNFLYPLKDIVIRSSNIWKIPVLNFCEVVWI